MSAPSAMKMREECFRDIPAGFTANGRIPFQELALVFKDQTCQHRAPFFIKCESIFKITPAQHHGFLFSGHLFDSPVPCDHFSMPVNGKNYKALTDEIVAMFPKALIDELAEVILAENVLSEDETKN